MPSSLIIGETAIHLMAREQVLAGDCRGRGALPPSMGQIRVSVLTCVHCKMFAMNGFPICLNIGSKILSIILYEVLGRLKDKIS